MHACKQKQNCMGDNNPFLIFLKRQTWKSLVVEHRTRTSVLTRKRRIQDEQKHIKPIELWLCSFIPVLNQLFCSTNHIFKNASTNHSNITRVYYIYVKQIGGSSIHIDRNIYSATVSVSARGHSRIDEDQNLHHRTISDSQLGERWRTQWKWRYFSHTLHISAAYGVITLTW